MTPDSTARSAHIVTTHVAPGRFTAVPTRWALTRLIRTVLGIGAAVWMTACGANESEVATDPTVAIAETRSPNESELPTVPIVTVTETRGDLALPSISTSNSGIAVTFACNGCTYVDVSGVNFTPDTPLQVRCEGNDQWFDLATTDGVGSFGPTRSVCGHSSGVPQLITVREADNPSLSASQLSQW